LYIIVDGHKVRTHHGATVLEAALAADIYIPHLCYDPELKPLGGCRLCLVEIQGMRGFPAACVTQVVDGMIISTISPELNHMRNQTLELLLSDHPKDCLTCVKNQHCELQKVTGYLGMQQRRLRHIAIKYNVDNSNPVFVLDRNYCVLCQKCTRTCDELVGANIIDVMQRGPESHIGMFVEPELMQSVCPSCKKCVVHCPVVALMPKNDNSLPKHNAVENSAEKE
jgi:NADH dehydrogenase/NADH:ubiquinone oxidoreductase subunit G